MINHPRMKIFFTLFIIFFSIHSLTKAEEITDFEIEGISIGESLLDHMTNDEIKYNELKFHPSSSKYYAVNYSGKKDTYEYVDFYIKRGDRKYEIYFIRGIIGINNKNKCLKLKNEISKEMKKLFKLAKFQEGSINHYLYTKSVQHISQFYYGKDARFNDAARVECLFLDEEDKKEFNLTSSSVQVIIQKGGDFAKWFNSL